MSHAKHTHRGRYARPTLYTLVGAIFLIIPGLAYGSYAVLKPDASIAAERHDQGSISGHPHPRILPSRRHSHVYGRSTGLPVSVTPSPTADPAPGPTSASVPGSASASVPGSASASASLPSSVAPTSSGAFPGPANTGYENAPGYPGQLTNCDNLAVKSNTTYSFCDFPNGLNVGSADNHLANITFVGCRFASDNTEDANVADYGVNIHFSYSTFEPSTVSAGTEPTDVSATPISASRSYQYGIDLRSDGGLTIDHSDFWGFSDAVQFANSSQAYPLVISNSWIHNPSFDATGAAHVDGILDSYGGASYMTFDHNTIVGGGNTQALALQGNVAYDHVTITNNYFSGYGYTLDFGGHTASTNMVFTGNVWGTDIEPAYGPVYASTSFTTSGLGNVWQGNKLQVVPGTSWMSAANNGLYWWPDDGNPNSSSQIVGHTGDYPGP